MLIGFKSSAFALQRRRVSVVLYLVLLTLLVLEIASPAVSGASFTTTSDGSIVNANLYDNKCDVYINGGPNNGVSRLTNGDYFFAVLAPGGQPDPNDGGAGNLSDDFDDIANRTFTVTNNHITSYGGSHESVLDPSTTTISDDLLLQLCDYANTPNPGGVYILAICNLDTGLPVTPRDCKYDAFKVKPGKKNVDLAAIKTANPSFSRQNTWDIDKGLTNTTVNQAAGTVVFDYTIGVTKTVVDSNYRVTGTVIVFNENDKAATGVTVTDSTPGGVCTVSPSGAQTIAAGENMTFTYECTFTSAQSGAATNTATITWNKSSIKSPNSSTTATANFNWANATVGVTGPGTVTVVDTFTGSSPVTLGVVSDSTSFNFSKTVNVNFSGCRQFTNRAEIIETGQFDEVTSEICANGGAHTMGFWQNKNGQALIQSATQDDLCAYLQGFNNVLADVDCSDIASWVFDTIHQATSSGDGTLMFKAQFLATALSAYFDSSVASTEIVVDSGLGFSSSCLTVSAFLIEADNLYPSNSGSKAWVTTVKDHFDRVNNNTAITC